MTLAIEIALILSALLALGLWGVISGVRSVRKNRAPGISPQELSRLAQPFRRYLGEAAAIQREVASQVEDADPPLRRELNEISRRIARLVTRAYPRALQGTRLLNQVRNLDADDATRASLEDAIATIERELADFLDTLKLLRSKVYRVLADAASLNEDHRLARDLEDALLEVQALEEVFRDPEPSGT